MSGLTREESDAWGARRDAELSGMTRNRAIALLEAYHAAAVACRGAWRLDGPERRALALALDRARTALVEAVHAEWRPE